MEIGIFGGMGVVEMFLIVVVGVIVPVVVGALVVSKRRPVAPRQPPALGTKNTDTKTGPAVVRTPTCTGCGTANPLGARFCRDCGANLTAG